MAGYSQTPLAQKLGLKPGMSMCLLHAPDDYLQYTGALELGPVPHPAYNTPADFVRPFSESVELIHYFIHDASEPAGLLPLLRSHIVPNGMIWVSWVKKSVKDRHIIAEDRIREIALDSGLVDVKVCAYDDTWSALKLVIRLKDR